MNREAEQKLKNYVEKGMVEATMPNGTGEQCRKMPKFEYLLMSLEEQCGEIEHLKSSIERTGHKLSDTREEKVEVCNTDDRVMDVPDNLVRLEIVLERLINLRTNLSSLNNKFESLI